MAKPKEKFGEDYFENSTISNYSSYRGRKFEGLAQDLITTLPLRPTDYVLDLGCATGALLFSLQCAGFHNVKGTDISIWAITEGRQMFGFSPERLQYYSLNLLTEPKDWLLALDVFEHMPNGELERVLSLLEKHPPRKGIVVRIPVSWRDGEDFVLDVSKNDRTHIQIHSGTWWTEKLFEYGFELDRKLSEEHIYDSDGVFVGVFKKVKT